jgi:hypothetical protein
MNSTIQEIYGTSFTMNLIGMSYTHNEKPTPTETKVI